MTNYDIGKTPKPTWQKMNQLTFACVRNLDNPYERAYRVMRWQQTPRGQRWMRKVAEWRRRDAARKRLNVVVGVLHAMPSRGYDFDAEGVVEWLYDHGYLKDSE